MGAQRMHLQGLKKQFVDYGKRSVAMYETLLLVLLALVQVCLPMVLLVVREMAE